jgi:hypothetical protein
VQSAKSTAVIEIEIENPSEKKPMDFFWSIRDYGGFSAMVVLAESSPFKLSEHFRQPKDLGNTRPTPRMGHQHQSPGQSEASPWVIRKTRFVALNGQYVWFILPLQGNGIWCAGTQGRTALCPGLICESPLG